MHEQINRPRRLIISCSRIKDEAVIFRACQRKPERKGAISMTIRINTIRKTGDADRKDSLEPLPNGRFSTA